MPSEPSPLTSRLAEPIVLPDLPDPPGRRPFPLIASLVPVVGAVVMWQVFGSAYLLWFAALGPAIALASLADQARGARRARSRALRELEAAAERAAAEISRRHDDERGLLRKATPDAWRAAAQDGATWRRPGALVLGTGATGSVVRVTGGEGERCEALRSRAQALEDAPVVADWRGGVCVRGPAVLARAVARAYVVQLALRHPPEALRLCAAPRDEAWARRLPHWGEGQAPGLVLVRAGEAAGSDGAAVIAWADRGDAVPHACRTLVEVGDGLVGRLVADDGDVELALEGIGRSQAEDVARALAGRQVVADDALPDGPVAARHVARLDAEEHDRDAAPAGLRAAIGLGDAVPGEAARVVAVDLVRDGPHAVVVGTTGAGKSELLTTWITALAAAHAASDLVFLLADFKGGTAFAHLAGIPHVSGIVTDLDGTGARRAVAGLGAEIRRRERALASAGARDVDDPRAGLARLVIVVDEFAALLQEHPDLHAVFTDIAARGRALGIHMILGTQRASGTVRDALLANAPLRIALRVAERRESAQIIGTEAAAELPGTARFRGVGFVRRAGDAAPERARFALTREADVRAVVDRDGRGVPADGPLLAPLPRVWRPSEDAPARGRVELALADDPGEQRQPILALAPGERGLVVLGQAASGKTSITRHIATRARAAGRSVVEVPRGREEAWDALERAEARPPDILLVDDADALPQRFPPEYAQAAAARLDQIVRDAGQTGTTVVLTGARLVGPLARAAELLPRRAVLAFPTAQEHVAAGGERALFAAGRGPGRGTLDGLEVQFAAPVGDERERPERVPAPWRPAGATALIARAPGRRARDLAAAWGSGVRVVAVDDTAPGLRFADIAGEDPRPLVLVGDQEGWQRRFSLLQEVRGEADVVVGADCATELRVLLGERELPPYARPRAARAWLCRGGEAPRRIVLP
ncbi:FtsK/SpoIIIE domain-containing protein [Microbacterium excoecariae]|uniref:FtsK/SpoIIIE domain-containing protein n=1 Tax=Microbacterium excoecariae TaxID=2715210 RepID=UPI00140A1039|nr:FtsK/SpoIIIE domain-containing protein [Microbacterium excoecariae]NHI16399.1 cell division protein FtsK [Microbacterium excoecariae]